MSCLADIRLLSFRFQVFGLGYNFSAKPKTELLLSGFCEYLWFFPFFSENAVDVVICPFSSNERRFPQCSFFAKSHFFQNLLRSYISNRSMGLDPYNVL